MTLTDYIVAAALVGGSFAVAAVLGWAIDRWLTRRGK